MLRKLLTSYGIAIFAAAVSFILALNIRQIVLMIVRLIAINQGRIAWGASAINAITVIILMAAWVTYIFYTQYFFEKKCETRERYIKGSLTLLLPAVASLIATEVFFLWLV